MYAQNRFGQYQCPCCCYFTLDEGSSSSYSSYAVCPVCYWEDDGFQAEHPTDADGANKVSLQEARANFLAYGASEREWLKYVHPPTADQLPDDE